jgi:hypothetical protein
MAKPTLFSEANYHAFRTRIENLRPDTQRLWGAMDAAQMMAHVSIPMEVGLGHLVLPIEFHWPLNVLIKWFILRKPAFKPNMQTVRTFVVADQRMFDREKQRLLHLLEEAYQRSKAGGPWARHTIFGRMTNQEWGILTYMHLDHHLRQFGV